MDSFAELDRALLLLYLDGNSYEEIAKVLGITVTNVATKISRRKHPAQIYEATAYLLFFLFNRFFLYRRHKNMTGMGFFTGWTLSLVFTARFLIEFVKERQVTFEDGMLLDMGQWLSIPFLAVGVGLVVMARYKKLSTN